MIAMNRVTQRAIGNTVLAGLQANQKRMASLQEQLSSGKLISKPSDSPTGTASALSIRAEIRANEQYLRNASDGANWLSTIETSLGNAGDDVRRVRDLVLQGMSDGTASTPAARDAIASEVEQLRDSLVHLGNATYLGRPVFGGATASAVAYDSAGTYLGDNTQVTRTIGRQSVVRVDMTGPEAFGSGATSAFTVLTDIAAHLRTDPIQLDSDLGKVDGVLARLHNAVADVGARSSRVSKLSDTAEGRIVDLKTSLSDIEDIDLPRTVTELSLSNVAYQAALSATSKVIQPSLVDFLR
jgi:flagellar hook-associated protein 3 FlgL